MRVGRQDEETLVTVLQQYVLPWSTMVLDCWRVHHDGSAWIPTPHGQPHNQLC